METYRADTIVACATPAGRGGIAIVRWSGRDALTVAASVFRARSAGPVRPWRMRLGAALAPDGVTPIDEVLGVYFPGPNSFTGEDVFEVHCHGSPIVVEQILSSAMVAGARAAGPGEFTRRAVLNGKLDLLQAEAVADLIDARMAAGARAAWEQLQGALSGQFGEIRKSLVSLLALVEADVDFTDDELPDVVFDSRVAAIDEVTGKLLQLLGGFASSRRQREGFRVAFTGKPNAGKSSLVNRLLGSGRMIVSEEPGTTRDVVEEVVDLGGIAFVLADSAGVRRAPGAAERIAVERAREAYLGADLRVLVIDASASPDHEDLDLWDEVGGPDTLVVLNKADLGNLVPARLLAGIEMAGEEPISTAATTGEGCEQLGRALVALAHRRLESDPPGISRIRHRTALENALPALRRARQLLGAEKSTELAALELRFAMAELAEISHPLDNEDVLDVIFSEFCIGK